MTTTTIPPASVPAAPNAASEAALPRPRVAALARIRSRISTPAMLAALAALVGWGVYADWKLPKFSALLGAPSEASSDDWCPEHSVPESACINCNADLLPATTDYGWCVKHGVAQCPLDHPDVAELERVPEISAETLDRVAAALALRPRPENNSLCKTYLMRIQFASDAALAKAGVDVELVEQRPIVEAISANGEVIYDQTRVAHLTSRATGTVVYVDKQVGDRVEAGEPLVLVDSTEVGQLKAELLQAITQSRLAAAVVERLRPLVGEGAIAGRQFREAEASLQNADARLLGAQQALGNLGLQVDLEDLAARDVREISQRIQFLGVPERLIETAGLAGTANLFALRAAQPGTVVERDVVVGEVANSGTTLFTLADPARMWLMLSIRQEDAKHVRVGQAVEFTPSDASSAAPIEGMLSWISTSADERTRTVQVRATLDNANGTLRANTFGLGRIVLRKEPAAVVVASEAVHWDGDCHVVFVRDRHWFDDGAPKFFHVRPVRVGVQELRVGAQQTGQTEILAGVLPGEVIASKNSVVLEGQLLKSKLGLGEGCGCAH